MLAPLPESEPVKQPVKPRAKTAPNAEKSSSLTVLLWQLSILSSLLIHATGILYYACFLRSSP